MTRRTAARSDTGRVREGNEDRFLVREDRGVTLMAVADGVGGGPGGEIAADAAVAELAERFFTARREKPITERLGEAMREANTAVLRAAAASGKTAAASTLVAAAVRGREAIIANLGDSRAYLVRGGESRQLTEDHSGALAHGITRFVGDPRGVQADVFVEDLRRGDRLLLCSDGLTLHVEAAEIANTLSTRVATIDDAADRLVALANSRGGQDNVTVIIYAAGGRSGWLPVTRGGFAFGIFVALVVLVVAGAFAALFSLAPPAPAPAPTAAPPAEVSPSPSATP